RCRLPWPTSAVIQSRLMGGLNSEGSSICLPWGRSSPQARVGSTRKHWDAFSKPSRTRALLVETRMRAHAFVVLAECPLRSLHVAPAQERPDTPRMLGVTVQVQYRPPTGMVNRGATRRSGFFASGPGGDLSGTAGWGGVAGERGLHGRAVELVDAERRILADREETGHVERMLLQGLERSKPVRHVPVD